MTKETKTILLIGGAAVLAYILLKPKQSTTLLNQNPAYYPPAYNPQTNTAQTINAGANALTAINDIVKSWFGGSSTPTRATVDQPAYQAPAINDQLTQPIRI